jgi:hypothetical protein
MISVGSPHHAWPVSKDQSKSVRLTSTASRNPNRIRLWQDQDNVILIKAYVARIELGVVAAVRIR